jgi:hypothetical protein
MEHAGRACCSASAWKRKRHRVGDDFRVPCKAHAYKPRRFLHLLDTRACPQPGTSPASSGSDRLAIYAPPTDKPGDASRTRSSAPTPQFTFVENKPRPRLFSAKRPHVFSERRPNFAERLERPPESGRVSHHTPLREARDVFDTFFSRESKCGWRAVLKPLEASPSASSCVPIACLVVLAAEQPGVFGVVAAAAGEGCDVAGA